MEDGTAPCWGWAWEPVWRWAWEPACELDPGGVVAVGSDALAGNCD